MDILSFIANIIKYLAWPTTTVLLVFVVRKELKVLLSLVRKIKAGPVEAEFERDIQALAADPEPTKSQLTVTVNSPERLALFKVAEASPRAAIMDAWVHVEQAVAKAVNRKALHLPAKDAALPSVGFKALAKEKLLEPDWIIRYYELRDLRNRAAHDDDFSPPRDSAFAYIELSSRLVALLNSIKSNN